MSLKAWIYLQWLKFLPRTPVDLTKTLHSLLAEIAEPAETRKSTMKNTFANLLEELGITTKRYKSDKIDRVNAGSSVLATLTIAL